MTPQMHKSKVPSSKSKAELHYEIAMQYFASLDLVVPTMKLHLD